VRGGRWITWFLVAPNEHRVARVTLRNGAHLYVDPVADVQDTIFWTGEYDTQTITRMERLLAPDAAVLDVGANIGAYAVQLGRALRGGGRLIAIEPVPANVERLRENIEANALTEVVEIINAAVGEREGVVHLQGATGREGLTGNAVVADYGIAASLTTIDTVAEARGLSRCDLIKLDVEGGEFAALRGAERLLRRCRPVLYLELNAHWMRHFGWSVRDLLHYLAPLGYELTNDAGKQLRADQETAGVESVWARPVVR
jgi:FkbM family methyltransferase